MTGANLFILKCADGSYYVGTTRSDLEVRVAAHNAGHFDAHTASRRPVRLVYAQYFDRLIDAIRAQHQIKRWSRRKKEALIASSWHQVNFPVQPQQPQHSLSSP